MSVSSRQRAQRRASRSTFSFARRPWFIAYAIALGVTAAVGFFTAPGTALSNAEPAPERLALLLPALEAPAEAAAAEAPLAASVVFTRVDSGFGVNWYEHFDEPKAALPAVTETKSRKARAVKQAALEPARSPVAKKRARPAAVAAKALAEPVPERFAGSLTPLDPASPVLLAYADPAPNAAGGVLDAMASAADQTDADVAALEASPAHAALPEDVPLPVARPRKPSQAAEADSDGDKPEVATGRPAKPDVDDATRALLPAAKPAPKKETKLAFARPNDPAPGDRGGLFKSLFGRGDNPKVRAGVAVYDISAAKVYMPDGSVLEAHSGIGKMADDPRYVHVKMNGPTPPQTYALKMREKRFHGVEAIRMTPIGDEPMHGRTGILAHSYLLRSRMAQSHGCVAFKDYPKFLAAFKAGKVKTMVVVPGGGRRVLLAKNGQGA